MRRPRRIPKRSGKQIGPALVGAVALTLAGCMLPRTIEPLDAGSCQVQPDTIGVLDVAIAIDRSSSTRRPSGTDADGDGLVGTFERSRYTDPDDSLLALQVAAAKTLLRETANSEVRYAIVSFAGTNRVPSTRRPRRLVLPGDADVQVELTDDVERLDAALGRVLERGSAGNTDFAAGMRTAVQSLTGEAGRESRKLVLFLSDGTFPIVVEPDRKNAIVDPVMEDVARDAIRAQIRFNTFGLGTASAAKPPHTLSHMAGATGGHFTPVEDPERLHCLMLSALSK